jgi:hypothetical protein
MSCYLGKTLESQILNLMPPYSWNRVKVGVKHQAINHEINLKIKALDRLYTSFFLYFQCFQYPNYFRIVLTVPKDKVETACGRIREFCDEHYNDENQTISRWYTCTSEDFIHCDTGIFMDLNPLFWTISEVKMPPLDRMQLYLFIYYIKHISWFYVYTLKSTIP